MRLTRPLAVAVTVLLVGTGTTAAVAQSAGSPASSPRPSAAVAAAPPAVGHAGQWLTDRRGQVVIAHGFNLVDKIAPYEPAVGGFGASDARFLARHGFTAVRLGVIPQAVEPRPGHFDNDYLRSLRRTQRLLARHGIRSLLDFHQDLYNQKFQGEGLPAWMIDDDGLPALPKAGFPANYFVMPALQRAFDNLWANAPGPGGIGLRDRYVALVRHVARFFRGSRGVLGIDVFNEPFPGTDFLTCFPPLGCAGPDHTDLAPFMSDVIRAVHSADPGTVAFFEPWVTFDYGAPTYVGRVAPGKVGMSFHDYCIGALGLPSIPVIQPVCNALVESRVIDNALHQARTAGSALLLSEFGAETNIVDLREVVSLADAHDISWLEWAYCACGDPTGSGQAESLVLNAHRPPRGSNINHTTLAALDEPYPQLVSGTPESSAYDPASNKFSFRYSTRGPTGRRFGRGALTRIYTSPLHYPNGYRVTVHGARVVSRPKARELVLAQSRRAGQVVVTIRAPLS
jgi:endoglycosylceramidase